MIQYLVDRGYPAIRNVTGNVITGSVFPNAIRTNVPRDGTLKTIYIQLAKEASADTTLDVNYGDIVQSPGGATNGVLYSLFTDPASKPKVLLGNRSVTVTGLNISVGQGDLLVLDVDSTPDPIEVNPISVIYEIDDGVSVSAAITIADEGTDLATPATKLNFVGAGCTASGTGAIKTITIPGGSGLTTEDVQDIVAALMISGNNTTWTYDDTANTLKVDAVGGSSSELITEYKSAGGYSLLGSVLHLLDSFPGSSIDTDKWQLNGSGQSIVSNRLQIVNTATSNLRSVRAFNFDNAIVSARFYTAPANANVDMELAIGTSTFPSGNFFLISILNGNVICAANGGNVATITYNSTNHAYLRMRFIGKTGCVFEASADGATWTLLYTYTGAILLNAHYLYLRAYNVSGASQTFVWDDVSAIQYGSVDGRDTGLTAFGDSITQGTGAGVGGAPSDDAHAFLNIIGASKGFTIFNKALGLSMISDQALKIFGESLVDRQGRNFLVQLGTNDQRIYKTDTTKRDIFQKAHLGILAYLAIPAGKNKFIGQSNYPVYSGTFSNTTINGSIGKKTTTAGDTITLYLFGSAIYLGFIRQVSNTAAFSVTIDGVSVGNISMNVPTGTSLATPLTSGNDYAPGVARFGSLSNTLHTVVLTAVPGASGTCYFDWAGGIGDVRRISQPNVWVGNIPKFSSAANTSYGTSDANVAAYNGFIKDNIKTLQSDLLGVYPVEITSIIDPTTDLVSDGVHPGDNGNQKMAEAYLNEMNYNKGLAAATASSSSIPIEFGVACSDESTAITTGTKCILRSPRTFTLTEVRATLTTASSSGTPTVNIKKNGTTIFTTKITINASARTSKTATTPYVLSSTPMIFTDDDEITIDVDAAGTGATGLKVWFIGNR